MLCSCCLKQTMAKTIASAPSVTWLKCIGWKKYFRTKTWFWDCFVVYDIKRAWTYRWCSTLRGRENCPVMLNASTYRAHAGMIISHITKTTVHVRIQLWLTWKLNPWDNNHIPRTPVVALLKHYWNFSRFEALEHALDKRLLCIWCSDSAQFPPYKMASAWTFLIRGKDFVLRLCLHTRSLCCIIWTTKLTIIFVQ